MNLDFLFHSLDKKRKKAKEIGAIIGSGRERDGGTGMGAKSASTKPSRVGRFARNVRQRSTVQDLEQVIQTRSSWHILVSHLKAPSAHFFFFVTLRNVRVWLVLRRVLVSSSFFYKRLSFCSPFLSVRKSISLIPNSLV